MILGVGIDLTNSKRFLDKNALAKRIMTNSEYTEYLNLKPTLRATRLAKTWAIKEALYKACPDYLQEIISWKNAEWKQTIHGKPIVSINMPNVKYKIHTSLSDEGDMITAIVILEEK